MSKTGPFWVYVLQNPAGKFSIGYIDDLDRRVGEYDGLRKLDQGVKEESRFRKRDEGMEKRTMEAPGLLSRVAPQSCIQIYELGDAWVLLRSMTETFGC
jgi:hypothetical protein